MSRLRRLLAAFVAWYQARCARWLRIVMAFAWAGLIWLSSSQSSYGLPEDPSLRYVTNGAHVGVYGVLAALIFLSTRGDTSVRFLKSVLFSLLYAAIDEWHQSYVPGRFMDPWDLCSDLLGALIAGCILWWVTTEDPRPRRFLWPLIALAIGSVWMASNS